MIMKIASSVKNTPNYEEVKNSFNKFIDLDIYFDHILLDYDDFLKKYGRVGFSFVNFFEVRLAKEIDALETIQDFITWQKDLLIIPLNSNKTVYKVASNNIQSFIIDNNLNTDDFIILHQGNKWVLVKDQHNKLIGIGHFIIKKMAENCFMSFGGHKVMHTTSSGLK